MPLLHFNPVLCCMGLRLAALRFLLLVYMPVQVRYESLLDVGFFFQTIFSLSGLSTVCLSVISLIYGYLILNHSFTRRPSTSKAWVTCGGRILLRWTRVLGDVWFIEPCIWSQSLCMHIPAFPDNCQGNARNIFKNETFSCERSASQRDHLPPSSTAVYIWQSIKVFSIMYVLVSTSFQL
jgi:hypothetical protein